MQYNTVTVAISMHYIIIYLTKLKWRGKTACKNKKNSNLYLQGTYLWNGIE